MQPDSARPSLGGLVDANQPEPWGPLRWGASDGSLGGQTPEHAPCDEATSGIKARGGPSSRPAL